jgi:hypothetical protein
LYIQGSPSVLQAKNDRRTGERALAARRRGRGAGARRGAGGAAREMRVAGWAGALFMIWADCGIRPRE